MVLDSDVVVRAFTEDDPNKAQRFREFLVTASNLILTDVIFAEIYWTLKSFYKFDKSKILSSLEILINDQAISCNLDLLQRTISILRSTKLSLIDSYTAAYSVLKSDSKILSFDKGFDKLKEIVRVEP